MKPVLSYFFNIDRQLVTFAHFVWEAVSSCRAVFFVRPRL